MVIVSVIMTAALAVAINQRPADSPILAFVVVATIQIPVAIPRRDTAPVPGAHDKGNYIIQRLDQLLPLGDKSAARGFTLVGRLRLRGHPG